jgi:hypothetical protein
MPIRRLVAGLRPMPGQAEFVGAKVTLRRKKSKLYYDRRPVGQSILVSGHHLTLATNFSFTFMENISRHLRFFLVERPL